MKRLDWKPRCRVALLTCWTAGCLAAMGCGSSNPTVPVRGTVQLEGAPLSGGKVLFTSLDGRKPAAGQIQPDGAFVLTTAKPDDGAAPGRYRVVVVSDAIAEGDNIAEGDDARVNCIPPADYQIKVESDQENDLVIDISKAAGWKLVADE